MIDIADGVYLNLPEDTYHELPFLSASGIKNILINPTVFWSESWMNEFREKKDSLAQIAGRAYHTRILEGKEVFLSRFAQSFEPPKNALRTIDDFKTALSDSGLPKTEKNKAELIKRVQENIPDAVIADIEAQKYAELHDGKTMLSPDFVGRVEIAAAMIEGHPEISRCFKGGFPEVTVIWTEDHQIDVDGETVKMRIRFKSRFDYLKPRAIVDLKTFANMMNKPIEAAIYSAMASYKYHIQAAFYMKAVDEAKRLIRYGAFFKRENDEIRPISETDHLSSWIDAFLDCDEHGFYFVFQQKGNAPVARCKKFPRRLMYGAGVTAIEQAIDTYKRYLHHYGTDMWLDITPIDDFEDERFPMYATEL